MACSLPIYNKDAFHILFMIIFSSSVVLSCLCTEPILVSWFVSWDSYCLFYNMCKSNLNLQFFQEIKEHGGTFIEELIVNITEREERKCIVVDLVAESSEERIKSQNEGGESSDASFKVEACAKPLDVIARDGVQALNKNASIKNPARVYQGLAHLTKCTKLPGGIFEVYKAGAIAEAIRLAKAENGKYITQAVRTKFSMPFCVTQAAGTQSL